MAPPLVQKIAHALHLDHKNEGATSSEPPKPAPPSASAPPPEVPAPAVVPEGTAPHPGVSEAKGPSFDHSKITVIFVLGGPGAGEPHSMNTLACSC